MIHRGRFAAVWIVMLAALAAAADMPGPRVGHGAALIGDKIYIAGGIANGGGWDPVDSIEMYDEANHSWSRVSKLPTPRCFPGVAALGGRLYVAGGVDGQNRSLDIVEVFDPARNEWSKAAPMIVARDRFALAALDGKLIAIGGLSEAPGATSRNTASVEMFDPTLDRWTSRAAAPAARHGHVAVALSGRAYVLGGYVPNDRGEMAESAGVESFDPATDAWRRESDMSIARTFFGAAVIGERIFVCGSRTERAATRAWFDPSSRMWSPGPALGGSRNRFATIARGTRVFVLGGEDDSRRGVPERFLRIFDTATSKWENE